MLALLLSSLLTQCGTNLVSGQLCANQTGTKPYAKLASLPYLPDFLFAPTATYRTALAQVDAGTGLPVAVELCDAFDTYATKTGVWGCLRADGGTTAWDGGAWLVATGTSAPAQEAPVVCPNGPSCGALAAARTQYVTGATGGQFGWEGTPHAPAAGAYTDCVHLALVAKDFQTVFAHAESGATNNVIWQTKLNSTDVDFYYSPGGGAGPIRRTVSLTAYAPHVLCVTCPASQLTGQAYLDGVASGATFTCAIAAGSTEPLRVSGYGDGTYPLNGSLLFGAFHTEAQLSAGAVASLSLATLASQPYGLASNATAVNLAFTRTTATTCDSMVNGAAGATGSILPAGRACVTRQGLRPQASAQNLAVRGDELDNAGWTAVGTPTESGDTALSPWGLLTADTIGDDDGAALEGEQQTLTTSAGQPYTLSVYARTGTGNKLRLSNDGTLCDFNTTADLVRYSCTDASASGTSTVQQLLFGHAASDMGNLILASAMFNSGSAALPYCPTTSSAQTCNADAPSFTGLSLSTASGIGIAGTYTSSLATNGGVWGIVASLYQDATNRTQLYRVQTNGVSADYFSTSGNRQIAAPPTVGPFVADTAHRLGLLQTTPGAGSTVTDYFDGAAVETSAAGLTSAFTGTSLFLCGLTSGACAVGDVGVYRDVCVTTSGWDAGCVP